ncbi:MAG: NAD(P)H-hydrate dehydratase [Burkholderiales bacterium]
MSLCRVDFCEPWPLFGVAATRRIEQAAMAQLAPHALMQRAGLAVARLALALAPHSRTIWIACGPGNNGGDGFEAAMHLAQWGKHPVVTWLGDEARLPADARAALQRARQAGVTLQDEPPPVEPGDLVVDALLGIGSSRPPEGQMRDWLIRMNSGPAPVLAVDLPSGLDADTGGYALDSIAEADHFTGDSGIFHAKKHTLSLLTLKPGLFTAHGRDAAGCVWFDDLDCNAGAEPSTAELLGTPASVARPHASHKGTFGDVAVIGGARGMGGAVLLAGSAALNSGAGKVFVAPLDGGAMTLDQTQPELMFRSPNAIDLESSTVVCGCGGGDTVATVLPDVLLRSKQLVLDADALNAIAADPALQQALLERGERGQPTVLTPHPLEAARLVGTDAKQIQADRLGAAQRLADRFCCTVVLKGSGTVIAARGRCPAFNPTGNAKLATAGTGDVLAGMIGAGLAARGSAWDAACAAVYRHGMAADRWPNDEALTAGRLAKNRLRR